MSSDVRELLQWTDEITAVLYSLQDGLIAHRINADFLNFSYLWLGSFSKNFFTKFCKREWAPLFIP